MPCTNHDTTLADAAPRKRRRPRGEADSPPMSPESAWSAAEWLGCAPLDDEADVELAHANRLALLGRLTASVAHEINQSIGALVINAETALRVLNSRPTDIEVVRRQLGRIVRDGLKAGEIVNRTRALSQKAPQPREGVQINTEILAAIEMAHRELVANRISVQAKLARNLPLVRGDRVQLQQVTLNLIVNAIQAMGASPEGERELEIRTTNARSGGVLIAVRDRGPGLDPAQLERVFDAFYTTKCSGVGIGLSICRSIVEAHRGRIWASPNRPCGSVFWVALPAD
jgi:signal transduction histidine kinase